MTTTITELGPAALELTVHGKLQKADYEEFNRLVEPRMQAYDNVGIVVRVGEMRGWTPAALWEDLKFDIKHYRDVARLAIVGKDFDKKWMATIAEPFTAAEVRYFIESDLKGARKWALGQPDTAAPELEKSG